MFWSCIICIICIISIISMHHLHHLYHLYLASLASLASIISISSIISFIYLEDSFHLASVVLVVRRRVQDVLHHVRSSSGARPPCRRHTGPRPTRHRALLSGSPTSASSRRRPWAAATPRGKGRKRAKRRTQRWVERGKKTSRALLRGGKPSTLRGKNPST